MIYDTISQCTLWSTHITSVITRVTICNKNVIITLKRRHDVVLAQLWRYYHVLYQIWFVFCTGCMMRTNSYADDEIHVWIMILIIKLWISPYQLIENSQIFTHLHQSRKCTIQSWISIARIMSHNIHAIYGKCIHAMTWGYVTSHKTTELVFQFWCSGTRKCIWPKRNREIVVIQK